MELQPSHRYEIWNVSENPQTRTVDVVLIEAQPGTGDMEGAVYTSVRTYFRSIRTPRYLYIQRHIGRLKESLEIEHGRFQFDEARLKRALRLAVDKSAIAGEVRIKIVIAPKWKDPILFMIEPLPTPDPEEYKKGVQVYTTTYIRKDPKAKVFEFVEIQDQIRGQFGQRVEEVIMLDPSGGMLEGLSSNFFAVKEGSVYTASRGVLNGITRQIVLDIARREAINVIYQKPKFREIEQFSECFITSTSRGVLPVVSIDHKIIGPGNPGPITRKLHQLFDERIPKLVEPI